MHESHLGIGCYFCDRMVRRLMHVVVASKHAQPMYLIAPIIEFLISQTFLIPSTILTPLPVTY